MQLTNEMWTGLITGATTIVAAIITFFATRTRTEKKLNASRDQYVDDRLKSLLEVYQKETERLRNDIEELAAENRELNKKVMDLILENKGLREEVSEVRKSIAILMSDKCANCKMIPPELKSTVTPRQASRVIDVAKPQKKRNVK